MSDYRDMMAGPTPAERKAAKAEAAHAARVLDLARANVTDAEKGLMLARLAFERAEQNHLAAARLASK